jgi:membrane dipeptidase
MRRQPLFRHADVPRLIEGGVNLAVLGVHYWPWESSAGWKEVSIQLEQMDLLCEEDARVVKVSCMAELASAQEEGKLAVMAGLEGAHLLGGNLDLVPVAKERGALYLTLAHFSKNCAATPSMGRGSNNDDGLTPFGRELIIRLNEFKLLVDLAHVNGPGVLEACKLSRDPVIVSHSTAQGCYPHRRGCDDTCIRAVADTGGVVGIMFAPVFLAGRLNASIEKVVDHICYVMDLVGAEHVAIGSDFDGWIPTIPNDIRDCRDLPFLSQKLRDRGLNDQELSGVLGENVKRIITQVIG